ncbi:hypothetical protein Droror1_Dr00003077 [Drosera rotundifolia]
MPLSHTQNPTIDQPSNIKSNRLPLILIEANSHQPQPQLQAPYTLDTTVDHHHQIHGFGLHFRSFNPSTHFRKRQLSFPSQRKCSQYNQHISIVALISVSSPAAIKPANPATNPQFVDDVSSKLVREDEGEMADIGVRTWVRYSWWEGRGERLVAAVRRLRGSW